MSIRKRVGLRSTPVCGKICVWIYFWKKKKIEKVVEKIRFAVLLCIRRFQTSEKVNSVLCCTALGKQRHDWIPRACQDARKHIAWLQSDARQSAGKGCLSGMAEGEKRTAITTDRAVEEKLPLHYCAVME